MRATILPLTGIRTRRGHPALSWHVPSSWWPAAAALAAAGCFSALVQGPLWRQDAALAAVNLAVTLVFVFTGLMLRKEPGQLGVAWALMLTGLFRSVDFIDAWNGPWPFYGLVFGGVDRLFGGYALLRYPNSSLLRYQRVYLIVLTVWMLVGRTLIAITSTAQWNGSSTWWWPALIPDQRLTDILNYVVNAGEGLLGATGIGLLVMRLVKTTGLDRIVITPFIVAGIAAAIAASASAVSQMLVSLNATPNGAYLLESAVDLSVPLAFLVAVIQRALLLRNLTTLTSQISEGADVSAVRYALRSTLHDPTLDVVDLSAPALVPELDNQRNDRLVEVIRTEAGTPIAVVIADPALARYRGLFDAAVQTSGLALKHAQLQAQAAREKLEQVRASRARIIEAGLAERRRIERDLHDGVQQHLLGLAARLTAATTRTTDPEATAAFSQARDELKEVLADLRDLAHGIHPAVLSQAGLAAALEEVVERLPLPVRLIAPASRAGVSQIGAAAEATAYFVTCEALTNVVKHAKADSATVTIRIDESHLDIEIADNGIGGVMTGGHGMTNILDRVSALDGAVTIDSPPGKGTRIAVRIPCC